MIIIFISCNTLVVTKGRLVQWMRVDPMTTRSGVQPLAPPLSFYSLFLRFLFSYFLKLFPFIFFSIISPLIFHLIKIYLKHTWLIFPLFFYSTLYLFYFDLFYWFFISLLMMVNEVYFGYDFGFLGGIKPFILQIYQWMINRSFMVLWGIAKFPLFKHT